jgi:exosortase D (VPLPA-CTERM-specific)
MNESMQTTEPEVVAPAINVVWRLRPWNWGLFVAAAALLALIYFEGLKLAVEWWQREEYSHGYMLPFIAAFLVWQKSTALTQTAFRSSWWGLAVIALGLSGYIIGELGTLYVVIQYAFLVSLGGVLLTLMGSKAFKIVLPPYILLFFSVPLPNFIFTNLSASLQLISSQLGVAFIRLFDISVFVEGNVIDLGGYKLQVVEACSGLRYLFPLMALGYIAAAIFKGALWKKVILFFASIPITVLMNSLRIGLVGVLVEYGGIDMAEGFIHDFEGWFIFMACAALLVLLMWLLARVGKNPIPLRDAFAISGPEPLLPNATVQYRQVPWSFYVALPALLIMAVVSQVLPHRQEFVPQRVDFLFFPHALGEWQGRTGNMDKVYLDALKLDDYLLADYSTPSGASVSLYVAWYQSQRKGESVHSPKSCLPGGGWQFLEFSQRDIPDIGRDGAPLRVNRALIQMGDERLLVYYWFPQRGRILTNEYLVKWYLFWDALVRNRTDGALVRLTTRVAMGQDVAEADALLSEFAGAIARPLKRFVPD